MVCVPVLGIIAVCVTSMHAIAHGGCTDTAVRESALKVDWETNRLPHQGIEPVSVLRLAFRSYALLTQLHYKVACSIDNKRST